MARATVTTNKGQFYKWLIFCPGCLHAHGMNKGWTFNGNYDLPTFSPSILVKGTDDQGNPEVCHSFVTDGRIRFLGDCTHKLKGQIVDLPDEFTVDFPDDFTEAAGELEFKVK